MEYVYRFGKLRPMTVIERMSSSRLGDGQIELVETLTTNDAAGVIDPNS
jgi:hypothetical protein